MQQEVEDLLLQKQKNDRRQLELFYAGQPSELLSTNWVYSFQKRAISSPPFGPVQRLLTTPHAQPLPLPSAPMLIEKGQQNAPPSAGKKDVGGAQEDLDRASMIDRIMTDIESRLGQKMDSEMEQLTLEYYNKIPTNILENICETIEANSNIERMPTTE